jgi:hypothetical protein
MVDQKNIYNLKGDIKMFNEKKVEKIDGQEFEVWQSPKYIESREKALEIIKSEKYNVSEGDFWILMNKTNDT